MVQWTELCQQALTKVKAALCGGPILQSPNFDLPFMLQTGMLEQGVGCSPVPGGQRRATAGTVSAVKSSHIENLDTSPLRSV